MANRLTKALLGYASLVALALSAHTQAGIMALTATTTTGSQNFLGTVGMDFDVNPGYLISIDALGAFDADGDGFDSGEAFVGIFDRTSGDELDGTIVLSDDPLVNGYRMWDRSGGGFGQLRAGAYVIAAIFFGSDEISNWGNNGGIAPTINDGGGAISFVGSGRFDRLSPGELVFPTTIDNNPANRYHAGTFEFTVLQAPSPVPAPATVALFGLGLAALGWTRRKKA